MALQLFPSFEFNESNVGPRPTSSAGVDRLAIVGLFNRGPVTPQYCDAESAKALFGFTNDVGSVHLQAMIDQGANSFLVRRVLPAAVKAKLTTGLSGTVTGAGSLSVAITQASTTVTATVSLAGGESATTVAASVIQAVNNLVSNTYVAASAGTSTQVVFTARNAGATGNGITVLYTLTTSTGLTFTPSGISSSPASLSGGVNSAQPALLTLEDASNDDVLTFNAAWPGASGNEIDVVVSAGSDTGLVDVEITYAPEAIVEVYRDVDFTDIYDEDKLSAFRGSQLVRATLIDGDLIPENGTFGLAGGTEGPNTFLTDDFTFALDELKNFFCTVVSVPGLKPAGVNQNSINQAIVAHCEAMNADMGEEMGLRIGVISAPRQTTVADIATLKVASQIPNSKFVVMVVGWATYAKIARFKRFGLDGAALYAARLLTIPVQISPAARTSAPPVVGITEVDTPTGTSAFNEITRARMDAIIPLREGGFHLLNGLSTASDSAWKWVCYRRVYNKIRQDLFRLYQFAKSEPQTPQLDSTIQDTGNGYFADLVDNGVLNGRGPVVSNESNNSAATRNAGKRFVAIYIEMVPPNDHMSFEINRVQQAPIRATIRVS